jgi:hypothetical protein
MCRCARIAGFISRIAKLSALLELIRRHRTSSDSDVPVVLINIFCKDVAPKARIGKTLLEKAPDEPFEGFEARAVAAAKSSGSSFVVIEVPADAPLLDRVSA